MLILLQKIFIIKNALKLLYYEIYDRHKLHIFQTGLYGLKQVWAGMGLNSVRGYDNL